jgi:pyruvate carboxylase
MPRPLSSLLVANRGEIAIRVLRAAAELGLRTVAVYSHEDRLSLHIVKADEAYRVGRGKDAVEAYLDIDGILGIARRARADAIHPGYGFLSENPQFAQACRDAGMVFCGPTAEVMRLLGNKIAARAVAKRAGVPILPAVGPLPVSLEACQQLARALGYPMMLKASWGGGGRGMRVIEHEADFEELLPIARREAKSAFGNDEVYLEKLVRRPRHVEVQLLGDEHGNLVHLFERDCTVQRRNQKVVERAPALFLAERQRAQLCDAALAIGRAVNFSGAGTVEFLQDAETGSFYFIEVNPRIQVEHTVTECITGIDLVKAQIRIAGGARIGDAASSGVPPQDEIRISAHAIQCRVTTEDPSNGFVPDHGVISICRSPAGPGVRLDAGTIHAGAVVSGFYDSLLAKVTTWASTPTEAISRMHGALREFHIGGVMTNLRFLERIVTHPRFAKADYSTCFIDETHELTQGAQLRDPGLRILAFISDVIANGSPQVQSRPRPLSLAPALLPPCSSDELRDGTKQKLDELGPHAFSKWMLCQERVLITDTAMRDAHQSLLATRLRTADMVAIAPYYARLMPELFSVECWGGATFEVAMRFLKEDPWERLAQLRAAMPNLLLQMLLRSANAVGYSTYPDNVVRFFIEQAAAAGTDVFRVFDSLNWVENMRVAIDAVLETGKLCETAICYSGDLADPRERKYTLSYYVALAKKLASAGAHVLAVKDMAGLCRPRAARLLVKALKEETGLPVHFHTHDTSGVAAASVLEAIEAGADAVDCAVDSLSGLTSQPNLGSIVHALRHGARDTGIQPKSVRTLSAYWEDVRSHYRAFESEMRSGASEVYLHGMPGGQLTNLREQARSLGVDDARWPEVAQAYSDVNELFGDVVKVTPTSKVVGDMALVMVINGLTACEVRDANTPVPFPESVVSFFRGDLGQPEGGFPEDLQRKVLNGAEPLHVRPGAVLLPANIEAEREHIRAYCPTEALEFHLASHLMYPAVWREFATHRAEYGDVSALPTPVFFYGMKPGQEIDVGIGHGKTLIIRYIGISERHDDGSRRAFFELNGEPHSMRVAERNDAKQALRNPKAELDNPHHIGAPVAGKVASISASTGGSVRRGQILATLEAMKMEVTLRASLDAVVDKIHIRLGTLVDAGDLMMSMRSESASQ